MDFSGFGLYGKEGGAGFEGALEDLRRLLADIPDSGLKAAREKAGLSQSAVALKSRISQPHVSDIENGHRALTDDAARRIGAALGVAPEHLEAVETMAQLKYLATKSREGLDPRLLMDAALYLEERLPQNTFREELLDVLMTMLEEAIAEWRKGLETDEAEMRVATKSRQEGPRRDAYGRRINKPNAPQPLRDPYAATTETEPDEDGPRRDAQGRRLRKPNDPRR